MINRKLQRVVFYSLKTIINFISYFNHRIYMSLYIPLLKSFGMKIDGEPRYIGKSVKFDDFNLISMGDRVVISDNCYFLTHDYSITTILIANNQKPSADIATVRGIEIGSNVFIGRGTLVMPNTKIGNNVVIGAMSVVRGNIPDGAIVIGNPCTQITTVYKQFEKYEQMLQNKENLKFD
jgi:acetyltransferase-like isoleucine patch superfamily enzyme